MLVLGTSNFQRATIIPKFRDINTLLYLSPVLTSDASVSISIKEQLCASEDGHGISIEYQNLAFFLCLRLRECSLLRRHSLGSSRNERKIA